MASTRDAGSASVPPLDHDVRAELLHVFREVQPKLYASCLRWLGGRRADAEDALSRVSIRALEDITSAETVISSYPGWLMRLAFNTCMDMHREMRRRRRATERMAVEVHWEPVEQPEEALSHRQLRERLAEAIRRLPPRLGEPCRRRLLEDEPYEVIAEALGLTKETVRKRIQEARVILRRSFS